jgi:hypothetical protein
MHRRNILMILVASPLVLLPGRALAQQKSIKDQLVGAWTVLLDDGVKADGTHEPLFGPNPIGSLILSRSGRYSIQVMRANRTPFASKNLNTGTPEETKAALQGIVSHFGSYRVDEAKKSLVFHVEGSSFPNLEGLTQNWQIVAITDEVMTLNLPVSAGTNPALGIATIEVNWKKVN